jgi:hypothetical protein
MTDPRRVTCTLAAVAAALFVCAESLGAQRDTDDKKPSLSLKATPPLGFSPLRVRVVVDVRGGSNDYADFYCAATEWDWGDGTISEMSSDCDPYEAGKSSIRRRYSAEHIFRQAGGYKMVFRLKQKTRTVAAANATIQVRAGSGEFSE